MPLSKVGKRRLHVVCATLSRLCQNAAHGYSLPFRPGSCRNLMQIHAEFRERNLRHLQFSVTQTSVTQITGNSNEQGQAVGKKMTNFVKVSLT